MRAPPSRLLAGLALASSFAAQQSARPRAVALPIDEPPRLDGRLDDACWQQALPIGAFTQVEPVEGASPIEATDVRVVYTPDVLYIGVRCHDREPSKLLARQLERDANLDPDDRVEILIDTFRDRRNAFWFQMNPRGDLGDALVANNGQNFNKPWDGIWDGRASIDEHGYCLEFALPFKTLNFREGIDAWGLNVRRINKRHEEESRWSNPSQDQNFFLVSEAGELSGLAGMHQGVGLDVTPFFVGRWIDDEASDDQDLLGDPGLDVLYKVTPSLNALLTINTDFADTEVDSRQINLTRFPLFFPEKRDFFLQDAGLFTFADLSPSFGGGSTDLIPFFSRRIGLDADGQAVPLLGGGKLTGRAGPWSIGLLDVLTDDSAGVDGQNLGVARLTRNVGEQSTLGAILTSGDPSGAASNQLYGFDANFKSSTFLGGKALRAFAWVLGTSSGDGGGDDEAFGATVSYPNDTWSWNATAKQIGEDFDAALGFVPRTGIRKYDGAVTFAPRPHTWIRQYEFQVSSTLVTDLDDELETAKIEVQPFGLTTERGDELRVEIEHVRDVLAADFEIQDGVTIPASDYDWARVRVEGGSGDSRAWSFGAAASAGGFYDGTSTDWSAEAVWRPSPRFNGSASYVETRADLPAGEFTTRVAQLRANITFSPTLAWTNFAQWDSESDALGLNSRLRWILEPGREVRVALNRAWEENDDSLEPTFTELAVKLEYTVRF
ncbi:MAG: carbohydrate binding family 9 domain-containing protein [Planctomycetes bacterium]|nr:carbohydrate binding family 9 domain-containing protein [Planctomycetota bacterium]